MPSFSSLLTSLTGVGFYYEKNPRHATYNFSQDGLSLYRNTPRVPFEFYININLNNVSTASQYIAKYFNNPSWTQVQPLIKSIEMPAMKIDTQPLNQYNRKRLSQSKIAYEPIKMVFHDVADGKTLKFWEMYYRYYFGDGTEPGKNEAKQSQQKNKTFSVENFIPQLNPAIAGLPAAVKDLFSSNAKTGANLPYNTLGEKAGTQNIIEDALNNHNFGYNLPTVYNIRNLIQSIDIYQVHGGRFNQVTLVNPRISAFTHDTLSYAEGSKTLELTFAIEYEYAYYTIQNMQLTDPYKNRGGETNNNSSIEQFTHGEFLELPALAWNTTLLDFVESNNPLITSDNPILQRIGKNTQAALGTVTGSYLSDNVVRKVSASALNGLAQINPTPYYPTSAPVVQARSFVSTATKSVSKYADVNRIGSLFRG